MPSGFSGEFYISDYYPKKRTKKIILFFTAFSHISGKNTDYIINVLQSFSATQWSQAVNHRRMRQDVMYDPTFSPLIFIFIINFHIKRLHRPEAIERQPGTGQKTDVSTL